MFAPRQAGLALAAVALLGAALLGGCAGQQEAMQTPPPGGPPPQMAPPPQMGMPPSGSPPQMGMPPGGPPPQMGMAPPQESYPLMQQVAQRVIEHYQTWSCQALEQERSNPPTAQKAEMEQRAMHILWNDPQMRAAFLNLVAAPIANKLFECDMIP
jgi:hypothetical protein